MTKTETLDAQFNVKGSFFVQQILFLYVIDYNVRFTRNVYLRTRKWEKKNGEERKKVWKREKYINLEWNSRKISCRHKMPCEESRSYCSYLRQNQWTHILMPPSHSCRKSNLNCCCFPFGSCIIGVFGTENPIYRLKISMNIECICYLCSQFGIFSVGNRFWSQMNQQKHESWQQQLTNKQTKLKNVWKK